MTTVLPHLKIAWGGSLGLPAVEVWTNSIAWMAKSGGDWDSIVGLGLAGEQSNMQGLKTAIQNWFQTPVNFQGQDGTVKGTGISPTAKLEWVKLNIIGADGKYMFASNTFFYPAPIPGGGANEGQGVFTPPWQTSTAITLRTTVSRGRGSHGRIYPPMAGGLPDLNVPYQALFIAQQMTNSFVGLLDNFNSGLYMTSQGQGAGYVDQGIALNKPGNCCIVSTSPTTGPHAGAAPLLSPILSVEIDRVPDVQTRRVNRVARATGGSQLVTLNV